MLERLNALIGYKIAATDGEIGKADDFFFDDQQWGIRYLVVATGTWLTGKNVLIAPEAMTIAEGKEGVLSVFLKKEQIENSPSVDTQKPVSRQKEIDLHDYYGWMPYWSPVPKDPVIPPPAVIATPPADGQQTEQKKGDPHLRSARLVMGYRIAAAGGQIGHWEDLIVETMSWHIRYLVIDTRDWLPGKKVLIDPSWLKHIDWADAKASTDLTCEAIKSAPEYQPTVPIDREYEERLYAHYNRPAYWDTP